MPFWLLKDAWLTCNRCSISVLPTPYWSPIKHLLRMTWQPIDWLLVTDLLFARVFYICRWFVWNYVMTFQNPVCILNVLKWKGCFASEGDDRMDSWRSWLCFCLMNHFRSSVHSIWDIMPTAMSFPLQLPHRLRHLHWRHWEPIQARPEIRKKLRANVNCLRKRLTEEGIGIGCSVSAIFPIMVRDNKKVYEIARELQKRCIFVSGITYPAVRTEEARLS